MKTKRSKIELTTQGDGVDNIYKQIEMAGRICYHSEMGDNSKAFCDKLIAMGHLSPLEHGSVYLKLPGQGIDAITAKKFYENNMFSKTTPINDETLVSTNMRVLVENGRESDLQFICNEGLIPTDKRRFGVAITTSRAIANEIVRHRVMSFCQESTRYAIHLRKNNCVDISTIIPQKLEETCQYWQVMSRAYDACEKAYKELLNLGLSPQMARDVLPLGLETQIMVTGFVSDWDSFIALRSAGNAHPEMRYIAGIIRDYLVGLNYLKP